MRAKVRPQGSNSLLVWLPMLAVAIASMALLLAGCAGEGAADRFASSSEHAGESSAEFSGESADALPASVEGYGEGVEFEEAEQFEESAMPDPGIVDGPFTGEIAAERSSAGAAPHNLPETSASSAPSASVASGTSYAPRVQYVLPSQPNYVISADRDRARPSSSVSAPRYSTSSARPAPRIIIPSSVATSSSVQTPLASPGAVEAANTPEAAFVPPSMAMESNGATGESPRRFGDVAALPDLDSGARGVAQLEERSAVAAAIGNRNSAAVQTASGTRPIEPEYETVNVFFATDRTATADLMPGPLRLFGPAAVACMAFCGLAIGLILSQKLRFIWLTGTVAAATMTAFIGHTTLIRWQQLDRLASDASAAFSATRFEPNSDAYPLNVGRAQLTIPPTHEKGKVESPSITRFEFSESPDKHIVLKSVRIEEHQSWFEEIGDAVAKSDPNQASPLSSGSGAFVFIHGYNVRFDAALKRTAQLATDLNIQGPAICFSWPSQGQVAGYTIDESTVNWSAPHFEQLILDLRDKAKVKSINIVAHSMGNRALLQAVERIGMRLEAFNEAANQFASVPREEKPKIIDQLIMAAPDVDARTFSARYTKYLPAVVEQTTMYFSAEDRALWLSQLLHGGSRVGLTGQIARLGGIDAVDIGGQSLFSIGHSYYGSDPAVIDDLAEVLLQHRSPAERRWLAEQTTEAGNYWRLDRVRHAQITGAIQR